MKKKKKSKWADNIFSRDADCKQIDKMLLMIAHGETAAMSPHSNEIRKMLWTQTEYDTRYNYTDTAKTKQYQVNSGITA